MRHHPRPATTVEVLDEVQVHISPLQVGHSHDGLDTDLGHGLLQAADTAGRGVGGVHVRDGVWSGEECSGSAAV